MPLPKLLNWQDQVTHRDLMKVGLRGKDADDVALAINSSVAPNTP